MPYSCVPTILRVIYVSKFVLLLRTTTFISAYRCPHCLAAEDYAFPVKRKLCFSFP